MAVPFFISIRRLLSIEFLCSLTFVAFSLNNYNAVYLLYYLLFMRRPIVWPPHLLRIVFHFLSAILISDKFGARKFMF